MVILPTEEELGQRSMREWIEDMHVSMGYLVPPAKLVQETWEKQPRSRAWGYRMRPRGGRDRGNRIEFG